jgi:PST family polysaccharide transporter
MTLRKKAIHGAKWSMFQEIISRFLDFFIIIILARLLDPKDFGITATATIIISAMRPFIAHGLGVAITQRSEIEKEHLDSAFWSTFIVGCLLSVFISISADWWATVFSEPKLSEVLPWLSISVILISLTTVQEAILRRELNFKVYTIRASIGKLIGGGIGIALAFYGFGVWSLVGRYIATSSVSVLLLWGISKWYPSFSFSRKHFRELFSFGIKVTMNDLLVFVNRNADSFLISFFLGSTALGYYNIAYKLMAIVFQLVSRTVSQVGMPTFARLQKDKKRLWKAFYDITQLISIIVFPIFLGMLILVPEIVSALLGEKWSQSAPVLQVLLPIGIIHCLLSPIIAILVGTGQPGRRLRLQALDSVVNLIGFAIAVQWGIVWVAASYVIVGYTLAPIWYWAITKTMDIRWVPYIKLLLRPLLITVVIMQGIITARWFIHDKTGDINFIILSVVGSILIYFSMTYVLYPTVINKISGIAKTVLNRKK